MDISNWIVGVVVGLIVCLIVVLILQNTVFKDKEMKLLYMVMFVLFAVCGGVMQNTYPFTDDSAITLTVAYYNPPCGTNYDGIGISPDVQIAESEYGDAQLDAAYAEIHKLIN